MTEVFQSSSNHKQVTRPQVKTIYWVWMTIIVSLIICASITWLHFDEQKSIQQAVDSLNNLRLARIDLNKGFVQVSLSGAPDSPFERESGIVLIKQAVTSIDQSIEFLDGNNHETKARFDSQVELFYDALDKVKDESDLSGAKIVHLRVVFLELENLADLVDQQAQVNIANMMQQSNRKFLVVLGINALLLLVVFLIVFLISRAKDRSEVVLLKSEAKFRAIFENNHTPMWLLAPDSGNIIDANPAASKFYGIDHDHLVKLNVSDFNILSLEEVKEEMQKALLQKRSNFIFRHRIASGEIRDVEIYSGPIEHMGQTLLYSIIHDVTPRIQAERALEESENRFKLLFLLSPIGIMVHDEIIHLINPAGAKILGAENQEQIIGKPVKSIVAPERWHISEKRLKNLLQGEKGLYPVEQVFQQIDGTKFDAELMSIPITYQEKTAVQLIFMDISDRKKSENALLQAHTELQKLLEETNQTKQELMVEVDRRKETEEELNALNLELEDRVQKRTTQLEEAVHELEAFSYSVSHDLRAPLRGINGLSYLVLEEYKDVLDDKITDYLQRIRNETNRMGQLIDDLLRLAQIMRIEIRRTSIDLTYLAETISNRLLEETPNSTVEITIEHGLKCNADESLTEIVLTNLISNAIKYSATQAQPKVKFGHTKKKGINVFFVSDNGVGFDMANASKLFSAFTRLHKPAEFPGSGVGLATVQRIVQRHGGKIWAESAVNQGATFYFTLEE